MTVWEGQFDIVDEYWHAYFVFAFRQIDKFQFILETQLFEHEQYYLCSSGIICAKDRYRHCIAVRKIRSCLSSK